MARLSQSAQQTEGNATPQPFPASQKKYAEKKMQN
jgi:hypothetical protein